VRYVTALFGLRSLRYQLNGTESPVQVSAYFETSVELSPRDFSSGGEVRQFTSIQTQIQGVVRKHNKPRPRVAHRGIARFLRIDPKLNQIVPWSLRTFPENFMQIAPAVFSQSC